MLGLTLAIGDFMLMLVSAAFWVAAGVAAQLLLGAGLLSGGVALVRRMRRSGPRGR